MTTTNVLPLAPLTTADDRSATIRTIRKNLHARGLTWVSVVGDRGTAWAWITIKAMPSKGKNSYGSMTDAQCAELAAALGLDIVHHQGVSVAGSDAYRVEFLDRSAGQTPRMIGKPYWD